MAGDLAVRQIDRGALLLEGETTFIHIFGLAHALRDRLALIDGVSPTLVLKEIKLN